MNLSKPAQSVQDFLSKKGIKTQVIEMPSTTRTAEDAAKAVGCGVAQIAKSLVFKTKNGNQPVLVLASGVNRVNEKTIARNFNDEIVKADADFVRDVTGFAIGGIPPVGHKMEMTTFIDEDLLQFEDLWAAAGTPNAVFCLKSKDLADLTQGKIISIK